MVIILGFVFLTAAVIVGLVAVLSNYGTQR
jgi:hypothetical protein